MSVLQIDEEIFENANKISKHFVMVCMATTIGTSLSVGYNVGVINAPAENIKMWANQTVYERYDLVLNFKYLELLWALTVSIFVVGGAFGSLMGGYIADKYGRKRTLFVSGLLFIIGDALFLLCRSIKLVEILIIGRLIVGLASGITTSTAPMYLAEISPRKFRGPSGTFISLGITFGIVFSQLCTLPQVIRSLEHYWHYALGLPSILIIIFLLPYKFFPESPKYLYIITKQNQKAKYELNRLLNNNVEEIDKEIAQMEIEIMHQNEKRSIISVLKDKTLTLPLFLTCALQGGSQLSGITAVFFYSVSIFQSAGLTINEATWANLGAGFLNFLMCCFSPFIMSRYNRRPTVILSCFLSGIFLLMLMYIVKYIHLSSWLPFASIGAIFGYIISFEIGFGPYALFIASELFESGSRPSAMALGSLSYWGCNFLTGMLFPILQIQWGAWIFFPFAVSCFLLAILLKIYLPETKQRDTIEISKLLSNGFRSKII